ncbi:MAG: Acg family FMN-binding oxidoreductase [Blastocatellia bacterium]
MRKYDFQINAWQVMESNFPRNRHEEQRLAFLLRYAVLAPSSHNTQPWRFAIGHDEIVLFVNKDRWLRVADADQRELYTSLGCALENLLIAAEHFGYCPQVTYFPEPSNLQLVAAIELLADGRTAPFRPPELFAAINSRHTNHKRYEARAVAAADLERLHAAVVEAGVTLYLTDDSGIKRRIDCLTNRADAYQFADRGFREELNYWIGEGAFGTPWLLAKLAQLAAGYLDLGGFAAKPDGEVLMNAPVFGLLCSQENDRRSQVMAGQAFERIYLTATALGLRLQPLSQLVAVPSTRDQLPGLLALANGYAQQPFRLGYAEAEAAHTPRRLVEEVMV